MNLKFQYIIQRTEKSEQWKKLEKGQWGIFDMSVNSSGKVLTLILNNWLELLFEKDCWMLTFDIDCSTFF